MASSAPAEILDIDGHEVRVSNPSKVVFPEPGLTKLDIVRYYLAVADGALRGAGGRPMVLKRFVKGIGAEAFFQKRVPENHPDFIDTATLRVGGKVVRLFGVEWVRGGQADELSKYLRGRQVSCQPAPGSSAHICTVEGRDLSEVVLFNGGGRASAEATPDLAAAEDHARTERLGVWKR